MLFAAFVIFLVAVGVVMVLFYASSPQTVDIRRRLSHALKPGGAVGEEDPSGKSTSRAENVFEGLESKAAAGAL